MTNRIEPTTDVIIMDDPLSVISEKDMEKHRQQAHHWYERVLKANPNADIGEQNNETNYKI